MSRVMYPNYPTVLSYAESDVSHRIALYGDPPLSILIEPRFQGLYLLGEFTEDCAGLVGTFDSIRAHRIEHDSGCFFKLGTDNHEHFKPMLALLCDIADRVQQDGQQLACAAKAAVQEWKEMFSSAPILSGEAERGLLGELWLLERLIHARGARAVDSWQGPLGELYDFGLGDNCFEVKTTLSRDRIHVISSIRQLQPSPGSVLYLVSLQLRPDGSATSLTLPDAVDCIASQLASDTAAQKKFSRLLRHAGYDDQFRARYTRRYRQRTSPTLIRVDNTFPVVSRATLLHALGADRSARVIDLEYSVSVEGLGHEDGSSEFHSVIPWCASTVIRQ